MSPIKLASVITNEPPASATLKFVVELGAVKLVIRRIEIQTRPA